MKKFTALLLVLCLSLCAFAALAEEPATVEITNEVSYEAVTVPMGDTGLTFQLPADWQAVNPVPENAQFCFVNAENTISVTGILCADFDTVMAAIDASVANGTYKNEVGAATINGLYYVMATSADGLYSYAYLYTSEENMYCFCFGSTDAEMDAPAYIYEMLGSVAAAE